MIVKALVVWLPNFERSGVFSMYHISDDVHYPIFPSRIGNTHPDGYGYAREEMPKPYEAELVVLYRPENSDRKGKQFYVGYPLDNRRFLLPGVASPMLLPAYVNNDLLTTHFLAALRYIRIFKGRRPKFARRYLQNDDLLDWPRSPLTDSDGQVECWIDYQMVRDNRLVGHAYPSADNQQRLKGIIEQNLPRELRLGIGELRGGGIEIPSDNHCLITVTAYDYGGGRRVMVDADCLDHNLSFTVTIDDPLLVPGLSYVGVLLECSIEQLGVRVRLESCRETTAGPV